MKNYTKMMTHDLSVIAISLDSQLQDWAEELQRTLGRAEAMRYPDCWSSSSIPHNNYDRTKAQKAKELARKIVGHVKNLIHR